jgi:signal peptidase I
MTMSEQEPIKDGAPRPNRWALVGTELLAWARTLASAAVYATLIVTFGFQVARVEGHSMEPTLDDQDRLVVNKLAYQMHDPEVGDIVMLLHPANPSLSLVKRVVAKAGDTVAFSEGHLLRNGVFMDDSFIPADRQSHEDLAPIVVPEGYYFVLGDHRNNSSDSRVFGPVPKKYILGRIEIRWWPFSTARPFEP